MKVAFMFLALVAFAAAAQVDPFADRSLSSSAVDAIEAMRDQMPCGFPEMGIPPLAPLKINHLDLNINKPALQVLGSLDSFVLNGLNDFEVVDMKINAITSKVTFDFLFNNVNFDTLYDMQAVIQKYGFTVNLVGNGPAKLAVKGINVRGLIRYSLGLLSRKLKLKTLDIRTTLGAVESDIQGIMGAGQANEMMNNAITEAMMIAVNENEDLIANSIEETAMPMINGVLDQYTLTELVSNIGGESEGEKEACIPPAL